MKRWYPVILWWIMTIMFFGAAFMLLIDGITFLSGYEEQTVSNTFQRFFGGSTSSWRAALFGFFLGSVLVHLTRWGAIPPKVGPK